jgi:hypothetical protein
MNRGQLFALAIAILWLIQSTSVKFCLDEFTAKDNVGTKYDQPAGGVAHPRPA